MDLIMFIFLAENTRLDEKNATTVCKSLPPNFHRPYLSPQLVKKRASQKTLQVCFGGPPPVPPRPGGYNYIVQLMMSAAASTFFRKVGLESRVIRRA